MAFEKFTLLATPARSQSRGASGTRVQSTKVCARAAADPGEKAKRPCVKKLFTLSGADDRFSLQRAILARRIYPRVMRP